MFKAPFSFEGRIRRTEYGLSFLLYVVAITILNAMLEGSRDDGAALLVVLYIPLIWLIWAQGAKRCHDLGNSGWWQLIPFYALWLIFQDGQAFINPYGKSPKQLLFRGQDSNHNESIITSHHPVVDALQAIQSDESPSAEQEKTSHPLLPSDEADPGAVQRTELEIQNVNYGLLQEILRTLRAVKTVQSLSYEYEGTVGRIKAKHLRSSQELLDELYEFVHDMEVLAVTNGVLKVRLK